MEERVSILQIHHDSPGALPTLGIIISVPHTSSTMMVTEPRIVEEQLPGTTESDRIRENGLRKIKGK